MHKKLVKKFYPGGPIYRGTPSVLPSLPDLSTINLNLPESYTNPYTSKTILGKNFLFNKGNSKLSQAFNSNNIGSTLELAGGISDTLGNFIPKKEQSALTTGLNQGYDTLSNIAGAIPVVGKPLEWGMKLGGMLSDGLTALGVGTDQMTTTDKILDSKFLKLTPLGLINSIGAKKSATITKNNEAFNTLGSAYSGTESKVNDAVSKSGKNFGLVSRKGLKDTNNEIYSANLAQAKVGKISDQTKQILDIGSAMTDVNNRKYYMSQLGGYQNTLRAGKLGLKFPSWMKELQKENFNKCYQPEPEKFKEGGKMNVIPEGALHARLHHMDVEGITKKGIPVITKDSEGGIVQHAEIERDEIIFTKEVTEKLEELYKKGTDEAAIEAGKILAREIMENTIDNTGLMQTIS